MVNIPTEDVEQIRKAGFREGQMKQKLQDAGEYIKDVDDQVKDHEGRIKTLEIITDTQKFKLGITIVVTIAGATALWKVGMFIYTLFMKGGN